MFSSLFIRAASAGSHIFFNLNANMQQFSGRGQTMIKRDGCAKKVEFLWLLSTRIRRSAVSQNWHRHEQKIEIKINILVENF